VPPDVAAQIRLYLQQLALALRFAVSRFGWPDRSERPGDSIGQEATRLLSGQATALPLD